jgi:hypothetical protein
MLQASGGLRDALVGMRSPRSLEQFTFSTKAVRQACRRFESFPLAFIYDLQLSQLPLNFFFD